MSYFAVICGSDLVGVNWSKSSEYSVMLKMRVVLLEGVEMRIDMITVTSCGT